MRKVSLRAELIERPLYRAIRDYASQLGYKDLLYLNVGEPDFPTPTHIVEAGIEAMKRGDTHYTEDRGLPELRAAIAEELERTRGIEVSPREGVIVTVGASEANCATVLSLIDPGDEVLLPDPHYAPYAGDVLLAGGKPVPVPLNGETLEWEEEKLKAAITEKTKLIIVNSPSNPTGGVFGPRLLKAISELAEDYDFYVLSDEVYEAFVYDGFPFKSVAQFDAALERTVLTNSFSKTFAMTGWRVGYLAGNERLVGQVLRVKGIVNMCPSSISQHAALAALKGPRDAVRGMLQEYSERRKIVLEGLREIPGLHCPSPRGAFYIFPDISPLSKDSLEFTKFLVREAHVVVSPGRAFGPGGEGHIRISYASSKRDLEEAVSRIKAAVTKLRG